MSDTKSNNFAVIETGGKQYKVAVGDVITVEKLEGEYEKGDKIAFEQVLLIDDGASTTIGDPYIKGAKVQALFEEAGKGTKIPVVRFRSKSRYTRRYGHRQPFTRVKITSLK